LTWGAMRQAFLLKLLTNDEQHQTNFHFLKPNIYSL